MNTILVLLQAALLTHTAAAGNNAGWTAPKGTWISLFSGKMNVPKAPKTFYNGHPLFLWPGLDPTGQATGLFQPVLTLGQGGNTPAQPWTMADWFSRCGPNDAAKYCHDEYQNVNEGDTLSWWVKRVGTSKVFPMQFEIGWRSVAGTGGGSMVQNVTQGARFMWATEAEAYFPVNATNYDWLPQSPFNIWDIVVEDQDGKAIVPDWHCEQAGGITLDCDWTGPNGEKGISMVFPQTAAAAAAADEPSSSGRGGPAEEVAPGSSLMKLL